MAEWCESRPTLVPLFVLQIILGCTRRCPQPAKHRGVVGVVLRFNPASVAHTDQFYVVGVGEHGVLALQFFDNPFYGGFHAERLAALNALKGFFLVDDVVR